MADKPVLYDVNKDTVRPVTQTDFDRLRVEAECSRRILNAFRLIIAWDLERLKLLSRFVYELDANKAIDRGLEN